ncbi:MAG TPA: 4Fe-4S dicluster domain-containing protein [Vicinamibacteria bacterium]
MRLVEPRLLDVPGFRGFLDQLSVEYDVIGPVVRDGAVVYDSVTTVDDLPRGIHDEQGTGRYRLSQGDDEAWFGYVVGPHSWKRFLHPPVLTLWRAERRDRGFEITAPAEPTRPHAFLGVRACELAAIAVLDRVLLGGAYIDPSYRARREAALLVAVNCGRAGANCFCASMQTGPRARTGFDLVLTEILEGEHRILVEVGSERGLALIEASSARPATPRDQDEAENALAAVPPQMGKRLETDGLQELLYRHYESPQWDQVAKRCLACANCTMVCPTCFCMSVEDATDLAGKEATRTRRSDSCFTTEFSYIHGGSVRTSTGARYRQWITHKLATWQDQYGSSGCVGCGRCITWCPVGIDLTEEVRALREGDARRR